MFRYMIAFLMLFAATLNNDELKLLQDPGGWEYIAVTDEDNGIQTKHTCFDGQPHPQECSGTLTLTSGNTFVQNVYLHGQRYQRHGKYGLSGDQLSLFDELGTKDGPYTVEINTQTKSLNLEMPQVRIELELEKEYRKQRQNSRGRAGDLSATR